MASNSSTYLLKDWLINQVSVGLTEESIEPILIDRGFTLESLMSAASESQKSLLRADLYRYLVLSPSRIGGNSDSDNGWQHTEGGYTLTDSDKKLFIAMANATYKAAGETAKTITSGKIKMFSMGVARANVSVDGVTMPREELNY